MATGEAIARELSIGEIISQTFDLYGRRFVSYFVLFLVVEALFGVVTTVTNQATNVPPLPQNPTFQQVQTWVSQYLGPLAAAGILAFLAGVVIFPIAGGTAIKMASDEIQSRSPDLERSIRFAASKLVWMWGLGIVAGILVILGLFALVVPGIILIIMFSLSLPVLLLENVGIVASLSRSRQLVGQRWLKTFATFFIIAIISAIAGAIASAISSPFGPASNVVSSILSAFYAPLLPIAVTVYYYSNAARTGRSQAAQVASAPAPIIQAGTKYCVTCGTQMPASAIYCPKCGIRQPGM